MTSESLVKNRDYGLTVVDIMLPGKNGFALPPEPKSYGASAVFFTARGGLSNKVKGPTDGAEDYMVKPFEMLESLVRIDRILKRSRQEEPEIHIKGVVIDLEKRTVVREGQEISLESMGFDYLVMFTHSRNRALTRRQLLTVLWLLFRGPMNSNL